MLHLSVDRVIISDSRNDRYSVLQYVAVSCSICVCVYACLGAYFECVVRKLIRFLILPIYVHIEAYIHVYI